MREEQWDIGISDPSHFYSSTPITNFHFADRTETRSLTLPCCYFPIPRVLYRNCERLKCRLLQGLLFEYLFLLLSPILVFRIHSSPDIRVTNNEFYVELTRLKLIEKYRYVFVLAFVDLLLPS
jgi:hypothetical protein